MKVSLNWVRFINEKYGCSADPAPDGIDALVERIGAQLGAVEEVIDLGKKYKGIVVVKVVSSQKHPNADKLTVCLVDDNKTVKKVNRDKNGLVEIVCGATNVKAGMLAAWIPPGVAVPSTIDKEPFVLEAREIRGIVSNGMLASAKELDLGDDHTGIVEIDFDAKPGVAFAELYGLNDAIIDIENKMFTHRPDCFGMLGIARELAGIQGHMFKSPGWYRADAKVPKGNARDTHKLAVKNQLPRLVPRFCAVVMKDVVVGPSPLRLKVRLITAGVRPVNNIVDLTNFFMLETAQPVHAYDYDKVLALQKDKKNGVRMGVRMSKKGESLKLLGGKAIKLDNDAALITADDMPIGLGGVMGGADTEVDENTKTIILECANFDMNATRHTAMKHGLFTDAATRFTKNQSPLQNPAVLAKTVDDILRIAGGRTSGEMIDDNRLRPEILKRGNIHGQVKVSRDFINLRLGLNLSASRIAKILSNVEFEVRVNGNQLAVRAPFWRTDIEIPEDIVEEVGRLYGYDHLPLELPPRDLNPAKLDPVLSFKSRLRNILSSAGANEVLSYSFVHKSLLQTAGQEHKDAYHIRNALSPYLQYYRLSLTPSLLEKVHPNVKARFDRFALFEIGKAHIKGIEDAEKLPDELERVALIIVKTRSKPVDAPFYAAKKYAEHLLNKLSISDLVYTALDEAKLPRAWRIAAATYEPKRSAALYSGKELLGIVGEPDISVSQKLKLSGLNAGFELDTLVLLKLSRAQPRYRSLNRFPSLDQDLCLRSSAGLSYGALTDFLHKQLNMIADEHGYSFDVEPLDTFQRPKDMSHKQTTWRITLWHPARTLTTAEVNKILVVIGTSAKKEIGAERI